MKSVHILGFIAGILLALAAGAPASAREGKVTSLDPASVVSALQDAGYQAKLDDTPGNDPSIRTAAQGYTILLMFVRCQDHQNCDQLEMITYFSCSEDKDKCASASQSWNMEQSFSHTVVTESGLAQYAYVFFDKEGISRDLFAKIFDEYQFDTTRLAKRF
jgi:hypothetical protein